MSFQCLMRLLMSIIATWLCSLHTRSKSKKVFFFGARFFQFLFLHETKVNFYLSSLVASFETLRVNVIYWTHRPANELRASRDLL